MLAYPNMINRGFTMKKEITAGLEDYIEAISNKIKESGKVRPIDLSKELNVSRASVSEALKRLSELGYINYGRYGAITITNSGIKAAEAVIEKHTLLHYFLSNMLRLSESEATDNACKIEHVISDNLLKNLKKIVEYNKKHPEFSLIFKEIMK